MEREAAHYYTSQAQRLAAPADPNTRRVHLGNLTPYENTRKLEIEAGGHMVPYTPMGSIFAKNIIRRDRITQLVELPTEKPRAILTWVRVPGAAKDLSLRVSFQCRLSTVCLLYTSPSPRDISLSRMPSSA